MGGPPSLFEQLRGNSSRRTTVTLLLLVLGFLVVHAWISSSDHDEIVYLHASWLVAKGARPFSDFVEHHHPAIYYLLAPLTAWVEPDPIAAVFCGRLVNLVFLGAWIGVTLLILRPIASSACSACSAVLLDAALLLASSFVLLRNSLEVRPDTAMCLFAYAGLWRWVCFLRARRSIDAVWAGVAWGTATVFLQKAPIFVGLVLLGSLVHLVRNGELQAKYRLLAGGVGLAVLGMIGPLAIFIALVARAGMLDDFYFWNYAFNRYYYLQSQASGNPAWEAIEFAARTDPVFWALGGWGVLTGARALFRPRPPGRPGSREPLELLERPGPEVAIALFVVLGTLVFVFRNQFPYQHNLMPMLPALGILGALQLGRVRSPRAAIFWHAAILVMLVRVGVLCIDYDENKGHREIQKWVLANSGPEDTIHVTPPYHPIYRGDAYFFWYDGARKAEPYAAYCRERGCGIDRLEQDRNQPLPLLVYLPPDYPQAWPVSWARDRGEYEETEIPNMFRRRR